ncbi:heavy metal translocating P-type ATPase [Nonomuraea sp. NPDC049480]|uniref:heavy metal translocating P-type ATPase n=1 Tax=Nonomuraea sp. NPDC049480 TaxID=3364353 RepID=UPI0037919EFF
MRIYDATVTTELREPRAVVVPPSRTAAWWRTGAGSLPEVRWAAAATALFAAGGVAQLAGAPSWSWWGLYLACYAAGGWEPGLAGLRALRDRTLDVDLLMVVAAIGAAAIGQVFDGALLIVIFATSGALEAVATKRTEDSVRGLLDLAPEQATRLTETGDEEIVHTAGLEVGEIILVRPGERIGADGEVVAGTSDVDQATITGESLPVDKGPGDEVFAGTGNGVGVLRVRVTRPAAGTVIARIVAMVEQAAATKAGTQLFIEKVEQRYSVAMVTATLALFALPLLWGVPAQDSLLRAMTFMIVASPCAIVLATMPPLLAAIATAGRNGVLVKSAVVMERLAAVDQVAFDKTGTLTEGRPNVAGVHVLPAGEDGADRLPGSEEGVDRFLGLAAAAEEGSEHPLGRAVVRAARERGLAWSGAEWFEAVPGAGVRARVGGRLVEIGSPAAYPTHDDKVAELERGGHTAVVMRVDGVPVAVLALADRTRPGTAGAVARLKAVTGTQPVLLTGDNPRAAGRVAAEVGIADVRAGLLPEHKVAAVRELQARGARVALVGDGINDAPALAAAHTGIAMGRAGSDLALDTADAVITRDEPAAVPAVISLARRARRLVVANLVIAGSFIAVLVAWDLFGELPLPLGVAGHEGSTVIVGLNGLRLLRDAAWRRAAAGLR